MNYGLHRSAEDNGKLTCPLAAPPGSNTPSSALKPARHKKLQQFPARTPPNWQGADVAEIVTVCIALLAILVAAAVYSGESRRTDFETARTLHLDLTSGEVAEARRLLGTLRYGNKKGHDSVFASDGLTAYFTVLWCFERIAAGRRTLIEGGLLNKRGCAVKFLDEAIYWHLLEWREGLPMAKSMLADHLSVVIDDEQSRSAFRELLDAQGMDPLADEVAD